MWFKNLLVYRFTRAIKFTELEKQLSEFKFTSCGEKEISKFGWTSPLGSYGDMFTHVVNGNAIIISAMKEEKILPGHVVKKHLNIAIAAEELATGNPVKKTQKQAIKCDVINELLPKAFTKLNCTRAIILLDLNLIAIDASSPKKAEDMLALLRKSIGSLPVVPVVPEKPLALTLTEWAANNQLPQGFSLGYDVELKDPDKDGGTAKLTNQQLVGNKELQSHIDAQKLVTVLGLNWQNQIDFKLTSDYALKAMKFADELKEQNEDIDHNDMPQRIDADFCLLAGTLSALIPDLFKSIPIDDPQK
ncbi:recombination-associated protein RdgC [Photobacterium toruni]|uniref:Recombination-associated protein RdgC n=1 Tax=Photobacterium toruni TaxID=1935446 RepID=A0ABU6L9N6_9GAMM|nr:recombination-associated protein RdgC [Photobacterium toruni]